MNENKILIKCFICDKQFQFGNHHYEGHPSPKYDIMVCNSCWQGNWDGWASQYEEKLLSHLKNNNLPEPQRNSKGWLPRD